MRKLAVKISEETDEVLKESARKYCISEEDLVDVGLHFLLSRPEQVECLAAYIEGRNAGRAYTSLFPET